MTAVMRVHDSTLDSDPSRVLWQLFLPGDVVPMARPRVSLIIDRLRAFDESEAAEALPGVLADAGDRATAGEATLLEHAAVVGVGPDDPLALVIGAAFTLEYALEGAALCNPSAVPHPDQSGLQPGQLRVAVSLRQIGEGHRSSIGFASAVVGPGREWAFEDRGGAPVAAEIAAGSWSIAGFREVLTRDRRLHEVARAVLRALPDPFTAADLEPAIAAVPASLTRRPDSDAELATIRSTARSSYRATFPGGEQLGRRTLVPSVAEESRGIEDARFTLVTESGEPPEYRATYTAYDGSAISSRLLVSHDLETFESHPMIGQPTSNKGMALFPRRVGGELLALSRTDGDHISLARSEDGLRWEDFAQLEPPRHLWDVVQRGNCGPPLETPRGWLVLTHGVGPVRRYSLGAMLLDLEEPSKVIAALATPLLGPDGERRDGYVPNVVYSCGGVVHDGVVFAPIGIGDVRIGVASIGVDELIDAMTVL